MNNDGVVLSHGHYDHTGGLPAVLGEAPQARVFLHPAALDSKFIAHSDGSSRFVGLPEASRAAFERNPTNRVETKGCTEVVTGLFATGKIPRLTDFEDVGGQFFLDEQGSQPDPLMDDQALFFDTFQGLVVLLGCGHAGVVNTLRYVQQLTSHRPVHALLGGMHLLNADATRLDRTVDCFRSLDIRQLGPAHCSGMTATARLWTSSRRDAFLSR